MAREAVTAQLDQLPVGAKIEHFNTDGSKAEPTPAGTATPARPAAAKPRRAQRRQPARSKTHVFGHFWCQSPPFGAAGLDAAGREGSPMAVKPPIAARAEDDADAAARRRRAAAAAPRSGVRYKDRDDVMLASWCRPAPPSPASSPAPRPAVGARSTGAARTWPRGKVRAHRRQCRQRQRLHRQRGDKAVEETHRAPSRQALGCPRNEVFMASTGVIGEPLDWEKIAARRCPALHQGGSRGRLGSRRRARIMTTDTFPKVATRQARDRRARR